MRHYAPTILSLLFSVHLVLSMLSAAMAQSAQENVSIGGEVRQGQVASFTISVPLVGTAGIGFPAIITARDASGNVTLNVTQDVVLTTINGGTISPITISRLQFTDDGIWTGDITLTRAGTARNITIQSGSAGGTGSININPGPLDRLEVTPKTITLPPGGSYLFQATAYDAYENVISGLVILWSVVNGGGAIDQNGSFSAGTAGGTFADTVRAEITQGTIVRSDTATVIIEEGAPLPPPPVEPPPPPPRDLINEIRELIRQNPVARIITDYIIPIFVPVVTAIVTLITVVQIMTIVPAMGSLSNLLLYTSYLWSALLALLGLKRRRRPWGVVFNAKTKEPIPLVIIQLIDDETGHSVEQQVSDPFGRFGFLVKPGRYRIIPSHPDFAFPSKISPNKGDLRYADLYHGEEIVISDPDTVLAVNIPLDPLFSEVEIGESFFAHFSFRRVATILLFLSVVLQSLTLCLMPSAKNYILFGVYLAALIFIAYALQRRKRAWGVVFDAATKAGIAKAQIFVTQDEDPRATSLKVTDEFGRFYLLLPVGTYRLSVQHSGYQFPGPADSFGYKGETISITPKRPLIYVDIPMAPANDNPSDNRGALPSVVQ